MIKFRCPNCNTVLQVSKEYAGRAVKCSSCGSRLTVPGPAVQSQEKAPDVSIICICGKCKAKFRAPSAGRSVECPGCKAAFEIPQREKVISASDTILFSCGSCGQRYCVLSKYKGKKFQCLACKQMTVIPEPAPELQLALQEDNPAFEFEQVPQEQQSTDEQSLEVQAEEESQVPEDYERPPAPQSKKTGGKSSITKTLLIAGAGLFGFVVGFVIVFNLVKSDAPETEAEPAAAQVQTAEISEINPEVIAFVDDLIEMLHQNQIEEVRPLFLDYVYLAEGDVQELASVLGSGSPSEVSHTAEYAREEYGAGAYIISSALRYSNGSELVLRTALLSVDETDEDSFEDFATYWLEGLSVHSSDMILASAGEEESEDLIANLDGMVDEYAEFSPQQAMWLMQILGPYFCMLSIIFLLGYLIMIICQVAVVINNGEPGWSVFVPMYRQVVLARIADKEEWMGWLCGFAELNLIFSDNFGFLPPVFMCASPIIFIIFTFIFAIGIAKSHGKGVGFGLGLFFLPIIFYPILAFSGKAFD